MNTPRAITATWNFAGSKSARPSIGLAIALVLGMMPGLGLCQTYNGYDTKVIAIPKPQLAQPKPEEHEPAWSAWIAQELGGEAEHTLFDRSRVDILTNTLAIEVEWCVSNKIDEAINQARYYATATGRKPAKEQQIYKAYVTRASRSGVWAVSVLDVTDPDLKGMLEHLGGGER